MSFQNVKGTRDFYPEDMAVRNWIFEKWRSVSLRNGFEEYDSPVFEYLELFTAKSGEEIVDQLYSFEDRGGRRLALRPEMTPTLARMINARSGSLPRPIKWYSMPRLNRAERQQRGRLREFFQWNIDIVGRDDLLADAETIFVAVDFFRDLGLTPEHVEMRINSRRLVAALLTDLGLAENELPAVYALLDRKAKLPPEKYAEQLAGVVADPDRREKLNALFECDALEAIQAMHAWGAGVTAAIDELHELFRLLGEFGVAAYCRFDIGVVRGLAYYTGPVFEAYGKGGLKRALCGGGRYDDLLKILGGEPLSGVGFATSDVVIEDVLREFKLLPDFGPTNAVDVMVIDADSSLFDRVLPIVGALRQKCVPTDFSYKRQAVGKQLKAAASRNARFAIIVGQETVDRGEVTIKNLETGDQTAAALSALCSDPQAILQLPRKSD